MQEKLEKKLCLNLHLKQNSHLHSFLGVTLQIETKLFSGYMISRCLVKLAALNDTHGVYRNYTLDVDKTGLGFQKKCKTK